METIELLNELINKPKEELHYSLFYLLTNNMNR